MNEYLLFTIMLLIGMVFGGLIEKLFPSAPHNINYTAALEEELLKHQLSDGLDLEESDYHNVAVCLNAAIQKWHCV